MLVVTEISCQKSVKIKIPDKKTMRKPFEMENETEANRYNQLMDFMSKFRSSMENSIRETNVKLDSRMDDLSKDMRTLN